MADVRTPPRKLVDLHPEWLDGEAPRAALEFDCPCGAPPREGQAYPACGWGRVYIPIAGRSSHPVAWGVTGETFETLTLTPSIHAVGHWHGWLRDGVLVSC